MNELMKFLRKNIQGDALLDLDMYFTTQLSWTFFTSFLLDEVIDGHLNFCSRPPQRLADSPSDAA